MIIYRRPDLTSRVFEKVRAIRPRKLFVAADGPVDDIESDRESCAKARQICTQVDWECDLRTRFSDTNQGCREAVNSALAWFFSHVDKGIVLEDDCVPDVSFFRYCTELLARYEHDERIAAIAGHTFQPPERTYDGASYYYSIYPAIWGWATWKRVWQDYDPELSEWPEVKARGWLYDFLGNESEADHWSSKLDRVYRGDLVTWDHQWVFSCWRQHRLTVVPSVNLVQNIGFDERATHSRKGADVAAQAMGFPLQHPRRVVRHYEADRYLAAKFFRANRTPAGRQESLLTRVLRRLREIGV